MKRRLLAVLPGFLGLVGFACGSDEPVISRIFAGPTWEVGESLPYQLRQRDEILGTCVLEVEDGGGPGLVQLDSLCASPDERYRDDRWVVVDAGTLTPKASQRTIARVEENKQSVYTATYGESDVLLALDAEGKHNETTRALPTPSTESPDPGYYDDSSLFWLVRGLPFAKGWEGAFRDVNPGNARVFTVRVRVRDTAVVSVPAGQFDTWEIEVRTESVTQLFWVEQSGARRVVRARIERDLYELLPD